jgi:hypothetical protein
MPWILELWIGDEVHGKCADMQCQQCITLQNAFRNRMWEELVPTQRCARMAEEVAALLLHDQVRRTSEALH